MNSCIFLFSCDCVLHFVLFSTAVSCVFLRDSVGLPGGGGYGCSLDWCVIFCVVLSRLLNKNNRTIHLNQNELQHFVVSLFCIFVNI